MKAKPSSKTARTSTAAKLAKATKIAKSAKVRAAESAPKKKSRAVPPADGDVDPTAPGPRMLQVLQAEIAPWRRDDLSDEEAQLKEIKRIPVRHMYDSEEARKRLVGRTATSGKRRLSRNKPAAGKNGTSTSSSSSAS